MKFVHFEIWCKRTWYWWNDAKLMKIVKHLWFLRIPTWTSRKKSLRSWMKHIKKPMKVLNMGHSPVSAVFWSPGNRSIGKTARIGNWYFKFRQTFKITIMIELIDVDTLKFWIVMSLQLCFLIFQRLLLLQFGKNGDVQGRKDPQMKL